MAYYWVTQAQRYIHSARLRRVAARRSTTGRRPSASTSGATTTRSPTDHPKNELRFGKGGVDDAEDAEVILHEYGHAIHFSQNFSFASEEAGAISEGFGDYWAVTVVGRRRALARRARARAAAVRRRLGLDLVHVDGAALPAARRH